MNNNNFLYYSSEKINGILNIMNQIPWEGLKQVQAIAQISVILSSPDNKPNENNENNNDKELDL